MKLISAIILLVIVAFLGVQIYEFSGRAATAQKDFSDIAAKLARAKKDQADFQAELDYYMNPVNLEKELRARFNYKGPGENLIIIVPGSQSSTASSSAITP